MIGSLQLHKKYTQYWHFSCLWVLYRSPVSDHIPYETSKQPAPRLVVTSSDRFWRICRFLFYQQQHQGCIFFIYCLSDNNVLGCNKKYGTYFRSKCRQCTTCLSKIYKPLNTAPALCYGLRFKNPSIEGSIITVDWTLSLHTNVRICIYLTATLVMMNYRSIHSALSMGLWLWLNINILTHYWFL